jgi:UDP-glucose 4-epimerase
MGRDTGPSKTKKAVVTGGAGFIGSHLAEVLVSKGYQVTIIDNLSTGKIENIAELLKEDSVEFVKGSITELALMQKLVQGAKYIFHQAALARVPRSIEDPLTTNETNITGTLNVLLAARENKVKKVIYASSSSVYGEVRTLPQKENMPTYPLSPYGLTKLAAEHYCEVFRQIYGLSTISLRYFNVYGPKQSISSRYATAIAAFIGRVSQNLPPIVYGDGEQSRDLTFVGDVVQANILAAESKAEGVFNIGSGKSTTINQLADLILKLTGKNLKPIYQSARLGDPRRTLADISKARSFGYEPKYGLEDGLRETLRGFGYVNV